MKSIGVTRNGNSLPADLATHSLAELAPNAFDNLLFLSQKCTGCVVPLQNGAGPVAECYGDVTTVIRAARPIRYNPSSPHSCGNAVRLVWKVNDPTHTVDVLNNITSQYCGSTRTVDVNSSIQKGAQGRSRTSVQA